MERKKKKKKEDEFQKRCVNARLWYREILLFVVEVAKEHFENAVGEERGHVHGQWYDYEWRLTLT